MPKKLSITLFFIMVFTAVGLVGHAQIWAKPPCEEVRIFDNRIMVVFEPGCEEVKFVYFWKGIGEPGDPPPFDERCTGTHPSWPGCSPTNCSACPGNNCSSCWRQATQTTAVMCTCEGDDCVDHGGQVRLSNLRNYLRLPPTKLADLAAERMGRLHAHLERAQQLFFIFQSLFGVQQV